MPNAVHLLTAAEVAERLQVHPESIRRWTREGKLVSVRLPSGRRRYREDDVAALLTTPAAPTEAAS